MEGSMHISGNLRRLVWFLPVALLIDITLGGIADLFLPSTAHAVIRHVFFFGSIFVFLFLADRHGARRAIYPYVPPLLLITIFIFLNAIWATVVPFIGHNSLALALQDARPFFFLVLVLPIIILLSVVPNVLIHIQRVVVVLALCVAVLQIGIWLLFNTPLVNGQNEQTIAVLAGVFSAKGKGVLFGSMPDGFYRVYWISSLWCLLGIFWIRQVFESSLVKSVFYLMFASSIFISYTRGIWLALLISVGLIFILSFVNSKRPILNDFDDAALLTVALGIIIAAVFSPTVRDRVEGLIDVDVSVSERLNQVEPLTAKWKERPILGNGYGAYVQGYVRDERTPYSYENVPAMLLMKLGVSGVLWFSGFFLVVVGSALRRIKDTPVEVTHLLAGLAALLITSMTNPYLISFVGMSVLGCLLIQWASLFNLSRKDEASRWRV